MLDVAGNLRGRRMDLFSMMTHLLPSVTLLPPSPSFFHLTHKHTERTEAQPIPESGSFLCWEQISLSDQSPINITGPLPDSSAYVCSIRICSSSLSLVPLLALTPTLFLPPFFSLSLSPFYLRTSLSLRLSLHLDYPIRFVQINARIV